MSARRETRRTVPPEAILEGHAPHVRALAERLRAIVRDTIPDVTEAGYPGWRLIGYRRVGYLGYVAPRKDDVTLGFEHGTRLPDPDGILEGTGAQVRYVRVAREADLREAAIRRLLHAAAAYDEERHR